MRKIIKIFSNKHIKYKRPEFIQSLIYIFLTGQATYKHVFGTRVSIISITIIFTQVLSRCNDLVGKYNVSLRHILTDVFRTCYLYTVLTTLLFLPFSWSWQWANDGCDRYAGDGSPDPTSIFLNVSVCSALDLCFDVWIF